MGKKEKEKVEGICKLCLNWQELRDSHILPKHLWKRSGIIGNGNHTPALKADGTMGIFQINDGLDEPLCCDRCEGQISEWETYAARYLYNKRSPFLQPSATASGYHLSQIQYEPFKLYLLSMLWRMGVSEHPTRSFIAVQLGSHQECLRQMLLADDPGKPWQYRCFASILTLAGKRYQGVFSCPRSFRQGATRVHKLVAAGIVLRYEVDSHNGSHLAPPAYLGKEGEWIVPVQDVRSIDEYRKHLELALTGVRMGNVR